MVGKDDQGSAAETRWLERPWWQGANGLLAALSVLVAVVGVVIAFRQSNAPSPRVTLASPPIAASGDPPDRACEDDTGQGDVVDAGPLVGPAAKPIETLDFGLTNGRQMNGSAWYANYGDRFYYWGRAGHDGPVTGGVRVRWSTDALPWHSCPVVLLENENGYVRSRAVATTMNNRPVTLQICLWRDEPRGENCTGALRTRN
jgi:hypothetical protein